MARLSTATSPALNISAIDIASAELGNLLLRLQTTVLHTNGERERRLRASEFERARVASNLDYARSSLTKLEHDALDIKAPGRRAEVQADLNGKREVLELLLDRLEDLRQVATHDDDDDDEASTDGEDILSEIIPTPSDSIVDSISTDLPTESSGQDDDAEPEPPEIRPEASTESRLPAPLLTENPHKQPKRSDRAARLHLRHHQHTQRHALHSSPTAASPPLL
ncbi:hypothetical protein NM208_g10881 [Fusarium decemcellulare]|uniref:Uncharacterized protein n=1 Tax=Fusarium decemcellulare TaxID=57161 RepID=A0ACC1RWB9_9HYPO|nr:hypothetical protein NM208_g10881 [Fusarium decemcellulare]